MSEKTPKNGLESADSMSEGEEGSPNDLGKIRARSNTLKVNNLASYEQRFVDMEENIKKL